ncbi:MAG TPA: hypothetical protein VMU02_11975, partial [bacterium]|nr:hypothetical protein [bacterium]
MSDPTGRAEPPAGAAAAGALLVRVAVTASVILLALVGAAAFLPGRRLWGINHLAFYPVALRIGLLALAGICFVPAVARKCYAALLGLARLAEARPRLGVSLIVAASLVSVAIFMRFHSATLLLGDGQLVANNFGYAAGNVQAGHAQTVDLPAILRTQPTAKGSTAAYYLAAKVSGGLSRHSPVAAIRGLNCILGGAFILVLLLVVMGGFATSLSAELRVWLGVLALSSGAMELFFGYIENYTPLLFFATLYVASSMVFMEKHRGAWLVAALGFLVASIFMHVAGILLLPSFGLLAGSIPIEKCRPTLARRLARWLAPALLVLVLVGTVGVAKFTGLGNDFLPLRTTGDLEGILSPAHWLDVLNEILLMMPAFPVLAVVAIASVLLARRPGLTARGTVAVGSELGVRHANVPGGLFALVVAAPCLLFLAVFKSEISVPRDWDLFALSSIGLVPAG